MSSPEDAVLVRHHLPTEALAAIKSLSDWEKAALFKVSKVCARTRLTRYGHEDLLEEASVRVLEGTRRWPTGVPFMAFMCGTMRGIAWDWRGESEIAPELTGHGLPLSKCEAYNRVYDQFYRSR